MTPMHKNIPVQASIGKRKVTNLSTDCHPAILSVSLCGHTKLQANCWLKDEQGRTFGMILEHDALIQLKTLISGAEQKLSA